MTDNTMSLNEMAAADLSGLLANVVPAETLRRPQGDTVAGAFNSYIA